MGKNPQFARSSVYLKRCVPFVRSSSVLVNSLLQLHYLACTVECLMVDLADSIGESLIPTRHRASTSMYSLTFRVRVTTHRNMDEMERPHCRCVDFIADKGSLRRHA